MSDIKEVRGRPRLHVSVNLFLEYGRHVARLHRRRRRRRRRACAPTSNTATHGTHEKINSWVPFSSLIWVWGSAWRTSAAGAPLKTLDKRLVTLRLTKGFRTRNVSLCVRVSKKYFPPSFQLSTHHHVPLLPVQVGD